MRNSYDEKTRNNEFEKVVKEMFGRATVPRNTRSLKNYLKSPSRLGFAAYKKWASYFVCVVYSLLTLKMTL